MSQASPSWTMTKFWIAAIIGAPIYFFEELLSNYRQRMQHGNAASHRADAD
jgi:hypothetical protein